jgi:hypothetical protein
MVFCAGTEKTKKQSNSKSNLSFIIIAALLRKKAILLIADAEKMSLFNWHLLNSGLKCVIDTHGL